MHRLVVTLALLPLFALSALAGEPTRFDIPVEEIRVPVDDWYGVYVQGQ